MMLHKISCLILVLGCIAYLATAVEFEGKTNEINNKADGIKIDSFDVSYNRHRRHPVVTVITWALGILGSAAGITAEIRYWNSYKNYDRSEVAMKREEAEAVIGELTSELDRCKTRNIEPMQSTLKYVKSAVKNLESGVETLKNHMNCGDLCQKCLAVNNYGVPMMCHGDKYITNTGCRLIDQVKQIGIGCAKDWDNEDEISSYSSELRYRQSLDKAVDKISKAVQHGDRARDLLNC